MPGRSQAEEDWSLDTSEETGHEGEQVVVRKKVEDSFNRSFTRELLRDSLVMPVALGRALILESEAGGPAIDR